MCIYFVLDTIMLLSAFLSFRLNQQNRDRLLAIICLLWALIFGFRGYGVQNDTSGYATFLSGKSYVSNWYTNYGTYDNPDESLEFGFVSFVKMLSFITSNPTILFLIQGCWIFGVIYYVFKKNNSKYALWSLTLLFLLNPMSISPLMGALRQTLSICLVLSGIILFEKEKMLRRYTKWYRNNLLLLSILCFALSLSFHRSAIFIIPILLILYHIKISKKNAVIAIIASFVISLLVPDSTSSFLDLLFSGITSSNSEMLSVISERYSDSFDNGKSYFAMFMRTIIILAAVYFADDDDNTLSYKSMVLVSILMSIFAGTFMINRILIFFIILAGPRYISHNIQNNKKMVFIYSILSILYLYKTYIIYSEWDTENDAFLPYNFFWE